MHSQEGILVIIHEINQVGPHEATRFGSTTGGSIVGGVACLELLQIGNYFLRRGGYVTKVPGVVDRGIGSNGAGLLNLIQTLDNVERYGFINVCVLTNGLIVVGEVL
jgi:hypothetical protein